MSRASYTKAVRWIADNDEDSETNLQIISELVTVCLVADVWEREPLDVAKAVLHERRSRAEYNAAIAQLIADRKG